jgi:hypothetical protein
MPRPSVPRRLRIALLAAAAAALLAWLRALANRSGTQVHRVGRDRPPHPEAEDR